MVKKLTGAEIRQSFLDFFAERDFQTQLWTRIEKRCAVFRCIDWYPQRWRSDALLFTNWLEWCSSRM